MSRGDKAVHYANVKQFAVITVDNPPVNALSYPVRKGLFVSLKEASESDGVLGIIVNCSGRTFIAGADISEIGKPPGDPDLPELLEYLDVIKKPIVAALHGTALGGGLETALCCNYRISTPSARFGLPEVHLGLIPGAGGTQRLPRLIGIEKALSMVTSGNPIGADEALECGLIDKITSEDLLSSSIKFLEEKIKSNCSHPSIRLQENPITKYSGLDDTFNKYKKHANKRNRGYLAPQYNIRSVEATCQLPFLDGLKFERELFEELMEGDQSKAQQYLFFAERLANKVPDITREVVDLEVQKVAVVGGGLMGAGIAMSMANAGLPVTIIESNQQSLVRCQKNIEANYQSSQKKGRLSHAQVKKRLDYIDMSLNINDVSESDLIIEAVFENMELKQDIFGKIAKLAKENAVLATNTSALDLNEIAESSGRPQDVIGLHFFSPANVMRLLEVVRAEKTNLSIIKTCMRLAKRIKKIPVLVGVCPGFVGNRILFARQQQAMLMAMQGVDIERIDRLMVEFGFPMGPFQTADLIGLDLGWEKALTNEFLLVDKFCEADRLGQKNAKGFYDYDENRRAKISSVSAKLIKEYAEQKRISSRAFTDEEILDQCLIPMINEGVKIREEGIVSRNSDIDVVYAHGFGWPAYRGGPMYYGKNLGSEKIFKKIQYYRDLNDNKTLLPSENFEDILNSE